MDGLCHSTIIRPNYHEICEKIDFQRHFHALLRLMEFGPNLRMPHSRAIGGGLFELRPRGREGIGRAFYYFVVGQRVVILHAFVKKTQETPEQELRIARKRMKEVQND